MFGLPLLLAPAVPLRAVTDLDLVAARDRWLLAVLVLSAAALVPFAPWLSVMALWFVLFWRSTAALPSLVTWIAIGASWALVRALPPWAWRVVPELWTAVAIVHIYLIADHRIRRGVHRPWGVLGTPPLASMVLALLAPFALAHHWSLVLPLAVGLWLTSSWLAILATLTGALILYPHLVLYLGLALAAVIGIIVIEANRKPTGADDDRRFLKARWVDWMPRGRSLDGLRVRLAVWRVTAHVWRAEGWRRLLAGRGPDTFKRDVYRWEARYQVALADFTEPLQHVHEYGAIGVAAAVVFAWPIVGHLTGADPYSASWLTGCVLMLGHWPLRWPTTGLLWLVVSARLA